MNNNLNQNLYSRFGLELNQEKVRDGFERHLKNVLIEAFDPLINPLDYNDSGTFIKVKCEIIREICRQLFLDYDNYDEIYDCRSFFEKEFYKNFQGDFNEYLFRLQVLINVIYSYKLVRYGLNQFVINTSKYLDDYPLLGVTIKTYKSKAPQLLPNTSKKFEQEIKNTLGLLESDKKYEDVLSNFEIGLKEFLIAKTQEHYKDTIEDMYTACDNLVKASLGIKNKGFRHISEKSDSIVLGLNGHQKELYKNLRIWMDEIKHGTLKNFDKNDTEMIISMVGSLIRFIISKQDKNVKSI